MDAKHEELLALASEIADAEELSPEAALDEATRQIAQLARYAEGFDAAVLESFASTWDRAALIAQLRQHLPKEGASA